MNQVSSGPLYDAKDRHNKSRYSLAVESPCYLGAKAGDSHMPVLGTAVLRAPGLSKVWEHSSCSLFSYWQVNIPGHFHSLGEGIRGV